MGKSIINVGKRANAFEVDPRALTVIGHDTTDGPEHPLYDERVEAPVTEEHPLVRRMVKRGWTHGAVEVRRNGKRKDGQDVLEVLAGRRRTLAARLANELREKQDVPRFLVRTFVRALDGAGAMELALAENELRENDTPAMRAEKVKRLHEAGVGIDDIAEACGVTTKAVRDWLGFFELAEPVRKAVHDGKVRFTAALPLAKLSREEQVDALQGLKDGGDGTTGRDIALAVRKRRAVDPDSVCQRPATRELRRVLHRNAEEDFLPDGWAQCLRWVLGEVGDGVVKGLKAARAAKGGA